VIRSPSTATATSVRMHASASSFPRRARAGPAHVTTCDALASMNGVVNSGLSSPNWGQTLF